MNFQLRSMTLDLQARPGAARTRFVLPCLFVVLAAGVPAAAQQTIVSAGPATITGDAPAGSLSDLAYDEANSVYLHVFHGGSDVWGRFVRPTGEAIGPMFRISINRLSFAGWPRAAYTTGTNGGLFLVTYSSDANRYDRSKNIFGQFVRFNGSGGELVGGVFPISEQTGNAAVAQEAGGLAFNSLTGQFLVTWSDSRAGWQAFARLFDLNGNPATGDINVSGPSAGLGQPNAAYDYRNNRFGVVYTGDHPTVGRTLGTFAKLLDGNNGQPVTDAIELNRGGYEDGPNITFLPEPVMFLAYWRDQQPGSGSGADVLGRRIDANGNLSPIQPVIQTPVFDGGPDGDYDRFSRRVLVAGMHDTGYVWAGELDGNGTPVATFRGSNVSPGDRGGSYSPRVAAGSNAQFGLSYMLNYTTAVLERWSASPSGDPGPGPGSGGGGGGAGGGGTPTNSIDFAGAPNGSWLFAEGVATADAMSFDTKYILSNESDGAVNVRGYFSRDNGSLVEKSFTVGARSRKTLSLRSEIGTGQYSAVIQSLTPGRQVFPSRSVTWGAGHGSTSEVASATRSRVWSFAEGSRNKEFFQNFYLVFNPNDVDATVRFTFYKPDGTQPVAEQVVRAHSRYTLWANAYEALANSDFSLIISSDQEVVAERAMYWGPNFEGGHDSLGTPTTSNTWYFAEGAAARAFETYYTMLNPNAFPIWIDITYYLDASLGRAPITKAYLVAAQSRATVQLNGELGNVGGVSALLVGRDGVGFTAERSIYWGTTQWGIDGTNVVGARAPAMTWHLPDGSFEGGVDSYVLVANPNSFDVTIYLRVYLEDGRRFTEIKTVPAGTRKTYYMRTDFTSNSDDQAALAGQRFTCSVQSVTVGGPIFAESAIYSGSAGVDYWLTGSATFGIPQ